MRGGGGVSGVTYPGPQGIIGAPRYNRGPGGLISRGTPPPPPPPPPPLVFSGPMGPSNDMLPRASLRLSPALLSLFNYRWVHCTYTDEKKAGSMQESWSVLKERTEVLCWSVLSQSAFLNWENEFEESSSVSCRGSTLKNYKTLINVKR